MSKVVVVLADGFEEIEAVSVIDILRRAEIETDVCSISDKLMVTSARGLKVEADKLLTSLDPCEYEMIVLPGGLVGAKNIDESSIVRDWLVRFLERDKYVAAICASPYVLAKQGLLEDKMATCFPTFKGILSEVCSYQHASVVVDENIITSRGPATAAEFAFTLVEILRNEAMADHLRVMMLYKNA